MRAVIYIPEASDDVVTSYQWYEGREHGLGEDFLQSIESCVTTILRHPQAFHQVEGGFRRAVMHRFPYAVFFKQREDALVIYAVFHCSQHPQKWKARLRKEA